MPGLNLGEAWEVLKSELAGEPDSGDKLFEAAKFVGKQVLLVSLDSWTYCGHYPPALGLRRMLALRMLATYCLIMHAGACF